MEVPFGGHGYGSATQPSSSDQEEVVELRKGPWTVEEDTLLANYVSIHGEGRWNSLARHAGTILPYVIRTWLPLSFQPDPVEVAQTKSFYFFLDMYLVLLVLSFKMSFFFFFQ